ncbi:MAG: matrixin family metalloprotease [Deltaproteobacteria bacterium]|nr:matrixin family metalloprotease [Deltaproteobacteria bacterium]
MRTLPALLVLLAVPLSASAYTINTGPNGDLYWDQSLVYRDSDGRIPFWIHYEGAEELSFLQEDTLRQAFGAWADVPGADLHFFEQRVNTRDAAFEDDNKAVLFYVEEGWEYDDFIIGLTLLTFDASGRIIDADIGFNAELFEFSLNDEPADVDLLSVATHEIGHFLGIGHSEFEESTMWATYLGGTEARSLHEDDIAAVEFLYPCEEMCRSIVDWRPRAERGCATGASSAGWFAACAMLGFVGGLRARSRRRRRGPIVAGMAALSLLLCAPGAVPEAESTLVERVDVVRLADASDRVVRGTVMDVESFVRGHVWSRITLEVHEDLKGEGGSTLVLEQPGGVLDAPLPSGAIGTVAFGAPAFEVGEEVVVFAADGQGGGGHHVTGLAQGKLSVASAGRLTRDLSDVAVTSVPRRSGPTFVEMPASLDGLRTQLRGR